MRSGIAVIALLALASCGKTGSSSTICRDSGCDAKVDVDVANRDVINARDGGDASTDVNASADGGSTGAPWASGRWRIPWMPRAIGLPPTCGPGTPTRGIAFFSSGSGLCVRERWASTLTNGGASVFDHTGTQWFALLGGDPVSFVSGCAPHDRLLVGATFRMSGDAALLRFDDPREDGTVLWTRRFPATGSMTVAINRILATEQLTIIEWMGDGGRDLLVGGLDAANLALDPALREAVRGRFIEEMQADANHMVLEIDGDIYLYTRNSNGTSTVENLTASPSMQFDPWVSGRYVVWVDQRHGPRGTAWSLDNTEIYLYDIETRTERRLTNDPPERPAIQMLARVQGDWIVWADHRNSMHPNTWPVADNVLIYREIRAHHVPTGREQVLISGPNLLSAIAIERGELWYNCSTLTPRVDGVYRMPMPAAPSP